MGVTDFVSGELIEIIEWTDDTRDTLSARYPDRDRAIKRARADYEALTKVSQIFSAALDEVPAMVASQVEAAKANAALSAIEKAMAEA